MNDRYPDLQVGDTAQFVFPLETDDGVAYTPPNGTVLYMDLIHRDSNKKKIDRQQLTLTGSTAFYAPQSSEVDTAGEYTVQVYGTLNESTPRNWAAPLLRHTRIGNGQKLNF